MAEFVFITRTEMTDFLTEQGFQEIKLAGFKEIVMAKVVRPNFECSTKFSLRVYTSVPDGELVSRTKGRDAIRVVVAARIGARPPRILGSSRRVHRVENWRGNLQERIDNWERVVAPCAPCSNCGNLMVERENTRDLTKFLGCLNYPSCTNTQSMPE